MSCPVPGLLPWVESLGDNCELGFYLRKNQNETGSLLRWAISPLDRLIPHIERNVVRSGFLFENLEPSSKGMVRDLSTGFCFHTAMRSVRNSNGLEFEHGDEERLKLYTSEKSKYDYLQTKFEASLCNTEKRIFVVKANDSISQQGINALHRAISKHKKTEHFILLAVSATGKKSLQSSIDWISDSLCLAQVERFAPYIEAFDVHFESWDGVFTKLAKSKKVALWLAESSVSDDTAALMKKWNRKAPEDNKVELSYRIANCAKTNNEFIAFINFLKKNDPAYHHRIGGDIFGLMNGEVPEGKVEHFDKRYLDLIQLYSNFNIDVASKFHASVENLYQSLGNSIVRYTRLTHSLNNTQGLLDRLATRSLDIINVTPKLDTSFAQRIIPLNEAKAVIEQGDFELPCRFGITIPKARQRSFASCTTSDDLAASESMWISGIKTDDINQLNFYMLPEARICYQPTGISFEEQKEKRFVHAMSDMYHYFRVAGKGAFGPTKQRLKQAYILPRFGIKNYYHALVDKLPGLYGYKLLGLNCPIISTYELDDSERHFATLLGIDPDNILVDLHGEITAEVGILPSVGAIRPLFFDFLADMPKGDSPLGRKIYISRNRSPERVMVNENSVHEMVERHGFEVVAMEDFSLDEQISIASSAETIVAPHGAGLANMVFSNKNTNIVELIPDRYMTPLFKQLSADCGHRYGVVIGKVCVDSKVSGDDLRWETNLQTLDSVLNDLAA